MGFDYGTKRIGIAFGQMITKTASPLAVVNNRNGLPDWTHITTLIKQWHPQALVIGLPMNMNNTRQNTTDLAESFAKELQHKFNLPIYLVDERLTTISAREEVFNKGGYKALQEAKIDAHAAKIILESWMNEQNLV
ncbi:MAG: Holliday junction DNA helicase RuvA [Gammaproteobacteria bacterium RIFCSPHIGHO2_12_FULL_35_23]|nr:MAG: Holliday junction DNA helicase RuvA [Gammaproteobacteria bacterium RIFCSPHIGHO2_12_FULL_35_23]